MTSTACLITSDRNQLHTAFHSTIQNHFSFMHGNTESLFVYNICKRLKQCKQNGVSFRNVLESFLVTFSYNCGLYLYLWAVFYRFFACNVCLCVYFLKLLRNQTANSWNIKFIDVMTEMTWRNKGKYNNLANRKKSHWIEKSFVSVA